LKTAVSTVLTRQNSATKEQAIAELEKLVNAESFLPGAYQQLGEGVCEEKIRSDMRSLTGEPALVQLRSVFESEAAEPKRIGRMLK
jgi:hypothetical protein